LRKLGRCGNFSWHWLPPRGKSWGQGISVGRGGGISLDRFDVINFTTRNLFLRVVVFDKKVNKTWVFGYSIWSAQEENREELLTELENVCSNQAAPLLIGAILIC
jgi:hypothetical protein